MQTLIKYLKVAIRTKDVSEELIDKTCTELIQHFLDTRNPALIIDDVVVPKGTLCEHPMSERADIANSNRTYCLKCSTSL